MFCVIFEVRPRDAQLDAYLGIAGMLRPELEAVEGFIDNIRYRSLTRDGWLLSVSTWKNEKALVRWRTKVRHHEAQEKGRHDIFSDYHLRVGQLTKDSEQVDRQKLADERFDETEVGEGTAIVLIDAAQPAQWVKDASAEEVAARLGFMPRDGTVARWDVFEAILSPGKVLLLLTARDEPAAATLEQNSARNAGTRLRRVRVIRDYGMFDRREAPQYYPDART